MYYIYVSIFMYGMVFIVTGWCVGISKPLTPGVFNCAETGRPNGSVYVQRYTTADGVGYSGR